MDWATLQTGLTVFVRSLLGDIATQWGDQPTKFVQGPSATIDLLAPEAVGVDDRIWEDVGSPDPTAVKETAIGHREIVVQVTVTSISQKLQDSARMYLERLRTRLRWTSSIGSLAALGLGLLEIGPVIEIDPIENGRVISRSALEVRCSYVHSETDAEIPFIETARISSELEDAAGDPLPAGLQFDITVPE